jgi:FHS family L-fucose permease-like MFS transporter
MNKKRIPLSHKRYAVPFALITLLFFLWGFARAILDVMNKHLQNDMNIDITQSSLIQVTTYLGYFTMAIPAGLFINRSGYRRGVVFGLILFGVGALMFIPSANLGTFYAFLVPLFIIGCGLTFLETAANPYVTELGPKETSASRLNLSQSFNGLGSICATFLVGQFFFHTETGGNVVVPYTIMGVIVLLIALLFSRAQLPEIKHDEEKVGKLSGKHLTRLFHNKLFLFGLFALLAYEVAEISINSYFINFVTGIGLMGDRMAAMVLTGALAFFMVGRFLGSWVMSYVRAERVLLACAIGTVVCIGTVLLDLGKISLIALLLNYVFEAIMFPTIFSLAVKGLGSLTKSASSLLMMTPVGGCAFLLMGLLADRTHMLLPFLVPFAGFILVLAYAYNMAKRVKTEEQ